MHFLHSGRKTIHSLSYVLCVVVFCLLTIFANQFDYVSHNNNNKNSNKKNHVALCIFLATSLHSAVSFSHARPLFQTDSFTEKHSRTSSTTNENLLCNSVNALLVRLFVRLSLQSNFCLLLTTFFFRFVFVLHKIYLLF